ncbi:MAG: substrate-binding domain-containing protein [Ruminococcus sp.]|jgi:phosphate transport system substrate-binding protein|nr:substrate-binding domain-containing protein [Ruminococcus sp.]
MFSFLTYFYIFAAIIIIACFIPIKIVNKVARTIVTAVGLFVGTIFLTMGLMLLFGGAGIILSVIIGLMLFITLIIIIWHLFPKIRRRRFFIAFAGLTAAGFIILTVGTVIDSSLNISIPVETTVQKFVPYEADGNLAVLDSPPEIDFDENYPLPVLDGATALYPYYAAVFQAVYPEEEYKDSDYIKVSNSENAYSRFIGNVYDGSLKPDVIFLAGLNDYQVKTAERLDMNIREVPIAKEAFVFIVNRFNPVDGLRIDQLKNIYNGSLDNWRDFGGYNSKIKLYMLVGENMGSNVAFKRYIGNFAARYIEGRYTNVSAMMGMSKEIADYKNYRSSLGYSYKYYIETMVDSSAIKMLEIDGIAPTPENIRNGSYPFTSEFIAVYDRNNPNPNVKILIDFIESAQGQELMEKTGYVGVN